MEQAKTGKLEIFRTPNSYDKLLKYAIFINGKKIKSIKSGETVLIPLFPGIHNVLAKYGWIKTNSIEVDIENGKTKTLHIGYKQIAGWQRFASNGFYIALLLIGLAIGQGMFIGIGSAGLLLHRTGGPKLY